MNRNIKEEALKKTVEHIKYEIVMFQDSAKLLRQTKDQFLINVLLESFAIHARNIFNFFYSSEKKVKKDDVIVQDYINNKKAFNTSKTPKQKLKFILKKADKQVAHLTYSRNKYNKKTKPWNFGNIELDFEKTINAFINSLPKERMDWFKN